MNELEKFQSDVIERIEQFKNDAQFKKLAIEWVEQSVLKGYLYNFSWLGRPIIQTPQDIVGLQEVIWKVKPDLIIETGIAHGGSLILSASLLKLIGNNGSVVGIDIDIREHNRLEIEKHPLFERITLLQGSSISEEIISHVQEIAKDFSTVMVMLDSNHTHEHVIKELELYSPLVTKGSYLIVFDTVVEDVRPNLFAGRPWTVGNSPKTAVHEFLSKTTDFEIDELVHNKLLITHAPDGFLRRVK